MGIDGWNSMDNCYAFLYIKEERGKKKRVLVKCLVIGDVLAIDVLDLEAQNKGPYNIQIKYVSKLHLLALFCTILMFLVRFKYVKKQKQ